jgi:hypothetical protein
MAKKINFIKGDCVSAKKWSGEEFLGIFEYTYDDGSYCVMDASNNRHFNVLKGCIKHATEEQEKTIRVLVKERNVKITTPKTEVNNAELEYALEATE